MVRALKTDEQCVDCGRILHEHELDLNGHLCNDCDHYRREMEKEPPYGSVIEGGPCKT